MKMADSPSLEDNLALSTSDMGLEPSPLVRTLMWPTVRRNLVVALVVGAVLNTINQGAALIAMASINWWQLGLNFCVPFIVASFGSWNSLRGGASLSDHA